jgi:general secretion pathway protein G
VPPLQLEYRPGKNHHLRSSLLIALTVATVAMVGLWAVSPCPCGNKAAARKAAADVDLKMIAEVLNKFEVDTGRFPTASEGLDALIHAPADAPNWQGPYLYRSPKDPWNNFYVYEVISDASCKIICLGADGRKGTSDDLVQICIRDSTDD